MSMVHFFDAVSEVRITSSDQTPADGEVTVKVYDEE